MHDASPLDRLCAACGIDPRWTDIWGATHAVGDGARRALLGAMGVAAANDTEVERSLAEREQRDWHRPLPPVQVLHGTREGFSVPLVLGAGDTTWPLRYTLTREDGVRHTGELARDMLELLDARTVADAPFERYDLTLPLSLPPGYHQLALTSAAGPLAQMSLIVAPPQCYTPPAIAGDGRVWGTAAQLYAVRSQRGWGIGDFSDLRALLDTVAAGGGDVVALNPLHAMFPPHPERASPYSPSSRLFLNVLYIDVEAVPEFACSDAAAELLRESAFQHRLRALRDADAVDYAGVAAIKLPVLERLYATFRERELARQSARAAAFRDFQRAGGERLHHHALYETLQARFSAADPQVWGWQVWPPAYRSPRAPAVTAYAAAHAEHIEFHVYLQWLADEQLGACGRRSFELGLGIGLYADLAVSIDRAGAEVWANQQLYAAGASIGAPPDDFNLRGQDWGLPPLVPEALREAAYEPFIATLRANMRHAGALRIDHVMALMRLYWIPPGATPAEGGYVHYPFADLLGILALESQRNQCLVIGEDLGTVPDEVRAALAPLGVLSYRLLYFEKDADGGFRAPDSYPRQALVAVSTHDLPTLAGFWAGTDLEERNALGLFPTSGLREQQIIQRGEDRARLLFALEREQLLPEGAGPDPAAVPAMTTALAAAVHAYLARTPARIMLMQLEDVLGQDIQVNLPGTTDERPNWRRRLPLALEALNDDERWRALCATLRAERPSARVATHAGLAPAVIPRATYRLQLHGGFGFAAATRIVPYLARLGVSHVYCSPTLRARAGSTHGYDIVDHHALNPELGSAEDYAAFVAALRAHGLQQILDVVPNHMGVGGDDNAWWLDVLEHGPASTYAGYFDIDWRGGGEELNGKLLLPILGDQYGSVLERGELVLGFDAAHGSLSIRYYGHLLPVDPQTYPLVLGQDADRLRRYLPDEDPVSAGFASLLTAMRNLPERTETDGARREERRRDAGVHRQRLADMYAGHEAVRRFVDESVAFTNGSPDDPASFDGLHALIEAQAYRPAHWRVAGDEINYRRFFDINDLAGLRTEKPEVFAATHALIMELIARGDVAGLRIDHPDGLYDPATYYRRLQASAGAALRGEPYPAEPLPAQIEAGAPARPLYVVAEKILAAHESLPEDWTVHGTTGYDFLNLVNGLFVDPAGEATLDALYRRLAGAGGDYDALVYERRKLIMRVSLSSELNVLAHQLARLAETDRHTRDFTLLALHDALAEVIACFPVYRTYVTADGASEIDRRHVDWAIGIAKRRSTAVDVSIFDFIRQVLLLADVDGRPADARAAAIELALRFQQYTAPVTAKGIEDTSFYLYNRLVSLNEVGGDPRRFATSVAAFHHANQERALRWPHALLATSTHDTKRAEDVRLRIDVLSEIADEWRGCVTRWRRINRARCQKPAGSTAPDANDEYLIYQTLIGVWPPGPIDAAGHEALVARVEAYALKAVREAKLHTSWVNRQADYEEAVVHFVREILARPKRNAFLKDLLPFVHRIARAGLLNGLVQTALKLTAPGVPDFYQGTELWDFSLVDPDNRRPVDFEHRARLLDEVQSVAGIAAEERAAAVAGLLATVEDGRAKLYLVHCLLGLRRARERLFRDGAYLPLTVTGPAADRVVAFARAHVGRAVITVASRWHAREPSPAQWRDTWVALPAELAGLALHDILSARRPGIHDGADAARLAADELFATWPVAVLTDDT
ncbi:MAG: malto-oligosyltrehalose synthase [Gammaproteobacteria bacterium]|nr:malto-oligosyltrehalose synthase [Gammaproteobacteria bacterium]